MKFKRFGDKIIIRIDKGEEIVETLKRLCKENNVKLGAVSGIGAVNRAVIGFFDAEAKKYHSRELVGNHEVASLSGNISVMEDEVYLHLHAVLCDINNNSFGGHLNSAAVSTTFEAVVDVIDGVIGREFSADIGLNLYKL